MEAQKIETEFSHYWSRLTVVQKESILEVVKHIVEPLQDSGISQEHLDNVMKDREAYLNGSGKTYSREEAREVILQKHLRNNVNNV